MIKRFLRPVAIFLYGIKIFPLYVLLKIQQYLFNDKDAMLFIKDTACYGLPFFELLFTRKELKEVLYFRLGYISAPLRLICGSYPLFFDNKQCRIGGGMRMDHPHGTHINAERIGENFTFKHNVTIRVNKGGRPIIGNNVFVACGACVLGGVTIGDNVIIGANCVIVKDVPDYCTVVGNPAIIVKQNGKKVNIKL